MLGLRLIAGMAVAYAILALITRAQVDMADKRSSAQQATALLVLIAAPAFATALLLGPAGLAMAAIRIAAFAALGMAIMTMAGRVPRDATDLRRLYLLLATGAVALTGLRLA
ncbi:MAG: hypothetical protein AAFT19_10680 [Pseudomonadota bacterium]